MKKTMQLPNNQYLIELSINEQNVILSKDFNSKIAQATYELYVELFSTIKKDNLGVPTRIWNYVPKINENSEANVSEVDKERYRQFNAGRLVAFNEYAPRDSQNNVLRPAATGVGSNDSELKVYCLVTNDEIINIENARQVSVYNYPLLYGSKRPSFSRGTITKNGNIETVFISGTASIINSETQHIGDVVKQTEESIENIGYLISDDNVKKYGVKGFSLDNLTSLKVYVRNLSDYESIKKTIESKISKSIPIKYVTRDICRKDLLVEIEGIASRG